MKNLNKKIGVVVLSGILLAGGGLAASSSVAHADSKRPKIIKEKAVNELAKSEYEAPWKLAKRDADKGDAARVEYQGFNHNYRVLDIAPSKKRLDYLVEEKAHLAEPAKYFVNVDKFLFYMNEKGKELKGFYNINIGGCVYIIGFGIY